MAPARQPVRNRLQLARNAEFSRLQKQLLTTAYELIVPLLRRVLAPSATDRRLAKRPSANEATQPSSARRHA